MPIGEAGENTTLTYSVVSNSNPALVSTSIGPDGLLALSPMAGQAGVVTLKVRATDSVGNAVDDQFILSVNLTDTYTTWASRNSFPGDQSDPTANPDGDAWNNLQEFAFMGNPAISNPTREVVFPQMSGGDPPAKYLTITFPVRKFTQGMAYAVEANSGLLAAWTEIWNSAAGFTHPQVLTIMDQADRTVVTIKDTTTAETDPKRFLRIRVVKQ